MNLYTISDEYISYAHKIEPKVALQENYLGDRDYCGIVIKQGKFNYYAPLSSYSAKKELKMKKRNRIIIRIFEKENLNNRLGYVLLNNMLPVPLSELSRVQITMSKGTPKEYYC
ncbi:type III toxin-antitoxin system ToxN/AbiQ family toxin [Xylocopilactobacillus apicola]|uniref:Type III toxin-antitoxin system ToxN/AbiQ family toxin n=1 Tax=Xylocopilactobacillus apicola TaxID=2932184 RepID=A0AAU9D6Z0_9LACO|nr:type III toxin-antitoxin system ToxN/AbiQ family toxin [Xylocopilactobacillus apicola]BDR59634.1 hypothetical protein XA3_20750 [Xylocopilactobacillus apicola]